MTIGIITDIHYADKEKVGNRYYNDSLLKMQEAISFFNLVKPDFIIELGDLIDSAETFQEEIRYLQTIEGEYKKFHGDRHYVFGNHDFASFSKDQFLANCSARKNFYSFDKEDFHFVIIDACYNKDETDYNRGNFDWTESYLPLWEQEWLCQDLRETSKKTIIFIHQRLDDDLGPHGVKYSSQIRKILEKTGNVIAVLQGHDHQGMYNYIRGIHYITFQAMVVGSGIENNAYFLMHIFKNGKMNIEGFGKGKDLRL